MIGRHIGSCFWLAVACSVACTDRSALANRADTPETRALIGTWNARFHLERAPLLSATDAEARHDVEGQLAFLSNRWLSDSYPEIDLPAAYGTYDIDFTPFGFDPRREGEEPTAVAGRLQNDSVRILLGSRDGETRVSLVGKIMGDSIAGKWTVSISRSGGGGGRFVIYRR
jgi:hypothetical protein